MNIENPVPGDSRKQTAWVLTQNTPVCICEAVFFFSRAQPAFVQMWVGSQDAEQARGSGVGPPSVSSNFSASVNLCLIALAWLCENGKTVHSMWKYRMHPRLAFECQRCGRAVGLEFRYGFQPNCPLHFVVLTDRDGKGTIWGSPEGWLAHRGCGKNLFLSRRRGCREGSWRPVPLPEGKMLGSWKLPWSTLHSLQVYLGAFYSSLCVT